MAFPEHYLLQFGGDFVSEPTEVWSNTIRFSMGGGTDGPALVSMTGAQQQAASTALLTRVTTHVGQTDSGFSSNVRVKFAKFNRIDTEGHYNDPSSTHVAYAAGAGVVGGGTCQHPITSALVITWLTGVERGPASRGRIFVPHPNVQTQTPTYRITSAIRDALVVTYRQLLLNMRADVVTNGGIGLGPSVVSERPAGGSARMIERVQVGDFLDYMGSRRNNLIENRTNSAVIV